MCQFGIHGNPEMQKRLNSRDQQIKGMKEAFIGVYFFACVGVYFSNRVWVYVHEWEYVNEWRGTCEYLHVYVTVYVHVCTSNVMAVERGKKLWVEYIVIRNTDWEQIRIQREWLSYSTLSSYAFLDILFCFGNMILYSIPSLSKQRNY